MRRRARFLKAFIFILAIVVLSIIPVTHAMQIAGTLTLNPGEGGLGTAVLDPGTGLAYFGTYSLATSYIIQVNMNSLTRVTSLSTGANGFISSVIDPANHLAYFGMNTEPGRIAKIPLPLSQLQNGTTLQLNQGEDDPYAALIDTAHGFAYFGTFTGPAKIVKVALSTFTEVGSITLNSGENYTRAAIIDPTANFAYFATYTSPSKIIKIDLNTFTEVGSLTLNTGEDYISTALIDPASHLAYFASSNTPTLVEVSLTNFTRLGSVSIGPAGSVVSGVIDSATQFAYLAVSQFNVPDNIVKVDLSSLTPVETIPLNPGQESMGTALIDPTGSFAYFGTTFADPGVIVEIDLTPAATSSVSSSTTSSITISTTNSTTTQPASSTTTSQFSLSTSSSGNTTTTQQTTPIETSTTQSSSAPTTSSSSQTSSTTISRSTTTNPTYTSTQGFSLTASPNPINIPEASQGTISLTVQSIGGFTAPVSLTASNLPSAVTTSFSPNIVTPPRDGSATSTATIVVERSVPSGTYNFMIIGISGTERSQVNVTLTVSGCLIATATYGSELSPEVQFLRDFRDYKILRTQAGSNFMIAFNAWYYSFSPTVAHLIAAHQSIRATMKVVLYPLIGILKLGALTFDLAPLNPELRAIISGLLVSTLIGVSYAALPFAMLTMTLPRVRKYCKSSIMVSYIVALGALTFIAFAEFTNSSTLMILATATLVLTTLIGSTLLTSEYISKGLSRLKSSV